MKPVRRIIEAVESSSFTLVAMAIAISMLAGTLDVIGIRLLNQPLRGSVEFSTTLMPIIVFVSLAYIQRSKRHIRVEFFYARARPRTQAAMDILNGIIVLIASIFLTWIAWEGALRSFTIREAAQAYPLPIYPVKFLISFGFALMVLRMVLDTVESIRRFRDPDSAPPPETVSMPME